MKNIFVETFVVGSLETNCHLFGRGTQAVLVDCGPAPESIVQAIRQRNLDLKAIYLTHLHLDHIEGVAELQKMTQARVFASKKDRYLADIPFKHGGSREFNRLVKFNFEDIPPGKHSVLGQPMLVLDTPGHTPGSLSYFFPLAGCVFVGDLVFKGSVGRTDYPGGKGPILLESIRNRIFILPDETYIYSGHGPRTTVSCEKTSNPFFTDQTQSNP